jgi:hypothetical protein
MSNPIEYPVNVIKKFKEEHSYINIYGVDPHLLQEFFAQSYIKDQKLEVQVDLLRDYILANDLTDVQP